jgi:hypothetical protein
MHLRHVLSDLLNGGQTCRVTQCDFHHIHTAFKQRVGHRDRLIWVGDDDDRHHA